MRASLLLLSGLLVVAAACGGKTIGTIGPGDAGSSGSSGSGSGGGGGSGGGSGGGIVSGGSGGSSGGPGTSCLSDTGLDVACGGSNEFGYQCTAGADPTLFDPSLDCSFATPDPDGVHDDYCCISVPVSGGSSGGPVPAGCTADTTLGCTPGALGFDCAAGDNPEAEDPTLSCSTPAANEGFDSFCCFEGFPGSSSSCVPDDELTSVCPDPTSYGYQCDSGDDPTTFDAQLNCSAPTPDADGVHDDFCCFYQ